MKIFVLMLLLFFVVSCGKQTMNTEKSSFELQTEDTHALNLQMTKDKKICDYYSRGPAPLLKKIESMSQELSLLLSEKKGEKSKKEEFYEHLLKLKLKIFIDPEVLDEEKLEEWRNLTITFFNKSSEKSPVAGCFSQMDSQLYQSLVSALEVNRSAVRRYNEEIGDVRWWLYFELKAFSLDERNSIIKIRKNLDQKENEYELFKNTLQEIILLGTSYGLLFDEKVRDSFLKLEEASKKDLPFFETELMPMGRAFYIFGLKNIAREIENVIDELSRYDRK